MIEILPIKSLIDEDSPIFGNLNVLLGKLDRASLPVAGGIVVTAPNLKLKTTLEHYDFKTKEEFVQNLTLVKKEIYSIPIPEILKKETKNHKHFLVAGLVAKSQKDLWRVLLNIWIESIKQRLWGSGFYKGITEDLNPQVVIFLNKFEALGISYFDPLQDDTVINTIAGKVHPNDLKNIDEIVRDANKKLFLPHEYEWIIDRGIKITGVKPFTPPQLSPKITKTEFKKDPEEPKATKSAVKVFYDYGLGNMVEKNVEGVFISSEKLFDLNKPRDSFENMIYKLVEVATNYPHTPILFKLADKSEGMGKVRGALRLIHQQSLLNPMVESLDFLRHKKGFTNVHLVIPFVRSLNEFLQIKRELSIKKLMRKVSLQHWLEIAVPENIINLESYLEAGLDGIVLNLDELIGHLNGFDKSYDELLFYKNDAKALTKFLEDSLRLLHKSKIPFIAFGSLSLYPEVLDFLVEKGVFGVVVEKYEVTGAHDLLHQTEKRLILRRSS